MNSNMGASILLSFAVVTVAAVVLYHPPRPESGSARAGNLGETETNAAPAPASSPQPPLPDLTPTQPMVDQDARAPAVQDTHPSGRSTTNQPKPATPSNSHRVAAVKSRRPVPDPPVVRRRPIAAFAELHQGETLADVALRVYGDRSAADLLWKANRDQVTDLNQAPPAGTVLRTP